MGKMRGAVVVDIEACKGCGLCVATCPVKILELAPAKVNRKGYPYVILATEEPQGRVDTVGILLHPLDQLFDSLP